MGSAGWACILVAPSSRLASRIDSRKKTRCPETLRANEKNTIYELRDRKITDDRTKGVFISPLCLSQNGATRIMKGRLLGRLRPKADFAITLGKM